jgi:hypothetical protein
MPNIIIWSFQCAIIILMNLERDNFLSKRANSTVSFWFIRAVASTTVSGYCILIHFHSPSRYSTCNSLFICSHGELCCCRILDWCTLSSRPSSIIWYLPSN